jgi:hypothetical protein
MSEIVADLFVEDRGHEALLTGLLRRLGADAGKPVVVRARSARGGPGRAFSELELYLKAIRVQSSLPDLLVVCIDSNCQPVMKKRSAIARRLGTFIRDRSVIACPDPHVERWYMADPDSFRRVVGVRPTPGKKKCERGRYKAMLAKAVRDAGHPPTLGGIEFAAELAEAMDLYRAGKNEKSLGRFLADTRQRLQAL